MFITSKGRSLYLGTVSYRFVMIHDIERLQGPLAARRLCYLCHCELLREHVQCRMGTRWKQARGREGGRGGGAYTLCFLRDTAPQFLQPLLKSAKGWLK